MKCGQCERENPADARFCAGCGQTLARTCPDCGRSNDGDARFCNGCGHPLAERTAPERDPRDYTPKHLADKILKQRSALEGERKQVTVLFADVRGATGLAEQLDPEEWHGILDRFFAILAEAVHRYEGTVNQYTGDGIMALFGAPIAHEDHAQRACYAALQMRGALRDYTEQLRLERGLDFAARIGINSGEVVVGRIGDDLRMDYTAQGATAHVAQRMEQLAGPERICLAEDTERLVRGFFELRDLGSVQPKGLSQQLHAYELERTGPLRTRLDLSRARGFSRLVGRSGELEALRVALDRALAGSGGVVGVVGEAGVGKSRLCGDFVAQCRERGLAVFEAHCPSHGRTVPLLPLLQLVRGLLGVTHDESEHEAMRKVAGELLLLDESFQEQLPLVFDLLGLRDPNRAPPSLDADTHERQVQAFLRRLVRIRGEREPCVFLVDDLHWTDSASDGFLAHLIEAASETRTLFVLNFRPEYRASWMDRSYYEQLALQPLGSEHVAELLVELLGSSPTLAELAERIDERAAGNPFFVEEIVRSLAATGALAGERGAYELARPIDAIAVPDTVQAILSARIDRLGEAEKHVLQTAAVIGGRFAESMLLRTAEVAAPELASALDALEQSELIAVEALYPELVYRFRHPLIESVARDSQLAERRRRVHAAIAAALEDSETAEEQAALIASHWEAAGEGARAARAHERAAKWIGRRSPLAAADHWRQTRRLAAEADFDERGRLSLAACSELLWNQDIPREEAQQLLAEGRKLAADLGDERALAEMLLGRSMQKFFEGDFDGREALVQEAGPIVARIGDRSLDIVFRSYAAWSATLRSGLGDNLRMHQEVIDFVGDDLTFVDTDARARAAYFGVRMRHAVNLGRVRHLGEGIAALQRMVELGTTWQELRLVLTTQGFLVTLMGLRGDPAGADRHGERAAELARELGLDEFSDYVLGRAHAISGRWAQAAEALSRCRSDFEGRAPTAIVLLSPLARAQLAVGEGESARATADEAVALAERMGGSWPSEPLLVRAEVTLALEGESAAVEADIERAARIAQETECRVYLPIAHERRADFARSLGDGERALGELREAQRLYSDVGATGHAERLARVLAG